MPPVLFAEFTSAVLPLYSPPVRRKRTAEKLRLAALVRAYLFTGMRRAEALGLLVADVDLAAGTIEIRPNRRRPLKTRAGGIAGGGGAVPAVRAACG